MPYMGISSKERYSKNCCVGQSLTWSLNH